MNDKAKKCFHIFITFLIKISFIGVVCFLVLTYIFGITNMAGEDMYPNIKDGDLIIYNRISKDYKVGDIIVYNDNSNTKIARIAGKQNDEISLSEDGYLKVNNQIQEERIFFPTYALSNGITFPYVVEDDSFFVLCDLRTQGEDSRKSGNIYKKNIKGKVISLLRIRGI